MVLKIVEMKRSYEQLIKQHFADHAQMALLTGPRQVGKTTTSQSIQSKNNTYYFNWDDIEDRQRILQGGQVIAAYINIDRLRDKVPLVIFDEIHKYSQWKSFIKGFYDRYHKECRILVTGSARLDVFKKGGDSLMGRYFYYRLHPLSVNELLNRPPSATDIQMPVKIADKAFLNLLKWGGFPEPYLKQDQRFYNRWTRLRKQQLFQEDIRELTNIQGLGQLEILATLIQHQTGELTSYSSLAKKPGSLWILFVAGQAHWNLFTFALLLGLGLKTSPVHCLKSPNTTYGTGHNALAKAGAMKILLLLICLRRCITGPTKG